MLQAAPSLPGRDGIAPGYAHAPSRRAARSRPRA